MRARKPSRQHQPHGAIDDLGDTARVVRGMQVALAVVVLTYTASTLPGVRSAPGFDNLLEGWFKNTGHVLAAAVVLARPILSRASRIAWALIAGAVVARAFAFVVHWRFVRVQDPVPYPSIADGGWILSAVLLVAGVIALAHTSRANRDVSITLDATVGALAAGAVAFVVLYDTLLALRAPGAPLAAIATNLAYPVLDAALVVAIFAAASAYGWRPPATVWWLLLGVGGFVVTDAVFLYQVTAGLWVPGTPMNALNLAVTAVFAIVAWVRPGHRGPWRSGLPDLIAPTLFALVCLGVLVYATQVTVPTIAEVLAAGGLVLSVGRTAISYHAVRSVGQLQRALESAEVGQYRIDETTGEAHWPPAVASLLHLDDDPATTRDVILLDHVPEADGGRVRTAEARAGETGFLDVTHGLVGTDGEVRVVRRRAQAIHDLDGHRVGWEGTIQDVTAEHRRAAERQVLLQRSVTAADDERQRLAEHLHDEVVQLLSAATLRLDLVDAPDEQLDQVHRPLAETLRLLRTTISELAHPELSPSSLQTAIGEHAGRLLEPDGIDVRIESNLDPQAPIDPDVLVTAYRITQEALSNVRRHARARSVVVSVARDGDRLHGHIVDDGVGIDGAEVADALDRTGHLGLRLMHDRAAACGGKVTVRPAPSGSGTEVRWQLPMTSAATPLEPPS